MPLLDYTYPYPLHSMPVVHLPPGSPDITTTSHHISLAEFCTKHNINETDMAKLTKLEYQPEDHNVEWLDKKAMAGQCIIQPIGVGALFVCLLCLLYRNQILSHVPVSKPVHSHYCCSCPHVITKHVSIINDVSSMLKPIPHFLWCNTIGSIKKCLNWICIWCTWSPLNICLNYTLFNLEWNWMKINYMVWILKDSSMGVRSGKYGGKERRKQPVRFNQ